MEAERPIWGVHMPRQLADEPVRDGFVAIGWSEVGDLGKIASSRDAFKQVVEERRPNDKPGSWPVSAGTLFKFVHEMKKGDVVIHPSKIDRQIHLGTVEGEYTYSPGQQYPNRRKVKWVRQMPRAAFSQSALHELGSAVTLFQVRNHVDEFMAALKGEVPEASSIDAVLPDNTLEETEERTKDFVLKRLHTQITWDQFEEFVAHLLECMGYHCRVTQKSGDGGIDVIASRDELGFEKPIIKVQCKQKLGSVGGPDVAQLYGHIDSEEHGLFVILGDFTQQARNFERSKPNLRLVDGSTLVDLVLGCYDKFHPAYRTLLPLRQVYVPDSIRGE